MQRRVSWNDCDPSGRIRFQAPFDWFVDAEVDFLRARGVAWVFGAMPRVAASATYRTALVFDDAITVALEVTEIGRSSLVYGFVVEREREEAVRGSVTCVYVVDGRSAVIPEDVRAALASPRAAPA